ncbi:MAG TPA: diguanylate cyclase [Caldimonas sp.]|nr:diguanylate cyclase [Caldimonas sp.]
MSFSAAVMLRQALAEADAVRSEQLLLAAVERARNEPDDNALYRGLDALALRRSNDDDLRPSLELRLQALEAARRAGAGLADLTRIESNIARNLVGLGLPDQAVKYAERAYRNAQALPAGELRLQALNALAVTQTKLAHHEQAQATYRQLAREARGVPGSGQQLWFCYVNRGACCSDEARRPQTPAFRRGALLRRHLRLNAMAARVATTRTEALFTPINNVEALTLLGRLDEAEAIFRELQAQLALLPTETKSLRRFRGVAIQLEGELEMHRGRHERAAVLIAQGIAADEELGYLADVPHQLDRLSEAEEACGRYHEALRAVRRAASMRLDLARAQGEARLRVVEAQQGMERARQSIARERQRAQANEVKHQALVDEAQRQSAAARTDALTGLGNRRMFEEAAQMLAASRDEPVAMALLDLDSFKQINDRFSHAVGDRVLVEIAGLLRGACRPEDQIVRMGGEEFVIVLRHAPADAALRACERLREVVRAHPWQDVHAELAVTLSIGLASGRTPLDADALLAQADELLYQAKAQGRDRVVAA